MKRIGEFDKLHISLDVHVLDPSVMSTTGTPVSNGESVNTIRDIIRGACQRTHVTSMDIVEFNPMVDPKNTDQSIETIDRLWKAIKVASDDDNEIY